jgi:pimeloyl-ACP methyl ester carboxylesterase
MVFSMGTPFFLKFSISDYQNIVQNILSLLRHRSSLKGDTRNDNNEVHFAQTYYQITAEFSRIVSQRVTSILLRPEKRKVNMNPHISFCEVNDTPLCIEQAGSGQPIVLLHGFGLDMRMWDDQFMTLAHRYRVIRYDLRGFGRSLPPVATPFSHAADLKGLLDQLKIEHTHILGLSLGGSIAVDFALLHPNSVNKLILADTALGGHRWSEAWEESIVPIWTMGRSGDSTSAKHLWLSHPLFEPALLNERCSERLKLIVEDYSGWHWANQGFEQDLYPPASERLGSIQASTLVIIGERDLPDFHGIADYLQRNIPDSRKVELAGVGHMSNMEAPEHFNEVVLAHLMETPQ